MQYWYSAQIRQYRLQFIRAFSGFKVKTGLGQNGTAELLQVPCRYGDPTRIAATIVKGNSENKVLTVPFITCYINSFAMSPSRRQDPQLITSVHVTERKYDDQLNRYTNEPGNRVTVDRYMPVPYDLTMQVDIWTNNEDIKEQLLEQILVLYNPAIDVQTSVNPIDWTVITIIEMLDNITWSSRSIPVGTENPIDVCTMQFKIPIWLNPPAKVNKQAIIQEIITNIVEGKKGPNDMEWSQYEFLARTVTTPGQAVIRVSNIDSDTYAFDLCDDSGSTSDKDLLPTVTFATDYPNLFKGLSFLWNGIEITVNNVSTITDAINDIRSFLIGSKLTCVLYNNTTMQLINSTGGDNVFEDIVPGSLAALGLQAATYPGGNLAWWRLLLAYGNLKPYYKYGSNSSQIRLKTVNELDQTSTDLVGWIEQDPVNQNRVIWRPDPQSLPIPTLDPINAIIDPQQSGPGINLPMAVSGQRYLLTESPALESVSWGSISAEPNDIIEYNGMSWNISWSASSSTTNQCVLNTRTNRLYVWNDEHWASVVHTKYTPGFWNISI